MIPYEKLSEDRKKHLDNVMRVGNLILKKYHQEFKNNLSIPKYNRIKFLNLIFKECEGKIKDVNVEGVFIPKEDIEKIINIKNVEWKILCAYSASIQKLSNKHRPSDSSMSQDDILSEAIRSAIVAIYHFTKEDVKFITFLQHCVNRHLTYKIGSFSRLSKRAYNLIFKYEKMKNKFNGPYNFENIVEGMDLSDKEVKILKNALSKTNSFSDLKIDESIFIDKNNEEHQNEDKAQVEEIISKLKLNDLEKAVLDGFLQSKYNSKTSLGLGTFAKNIINSSTGKPYSRASLSLAWNRIKNKISDMYKAA